MDLAREAVHDITPLGRCKDGQVTWEHLCNGHTWTHDRYTVDKVWDLDHRYSHRYM